MNQQNLGGIRLKEVITFQTQIMMGAQFGRVMSKEPEEIIIACLRMGWNDAFRHTSKNKKNGEKSVLEEGETKWRQKHEVPHDDYICGNILNQDPVRKAFRDFALAGSTEAKVNTIKSHYPELELLFGQYKETTGKQKLCFGHFQKMFNIAIKLYVCLYLCREWLDLPTDVFEEDILNNIQNADCPVDSIILEHLAKDSENTKYKSHKWSQYEHNDGNYQQAQDEISRLDKTAGKSNLYYDFIAWNREQVSRKDHE